MQPPAARHLAVLAAAALFIGGAALDAPALAEDPSSGEIVDALKPKVKYRAFDPAQEERESRQADLVKRLQRERTRAITVEERDEIATVVKENELPAIDLEVFFNFDSSEITPEALPILKKLGEALSDEKLKGSVFLVAGHTDAKGSDAYNLSLSDARAKSVQTFLIENFKLDPKQLVALGFGEEQLKNRDNPFSGENRRVQVVNMASADVAAKASEPAEDTAPAEKGE
ncbi:MAG TPA: OmpA family protein [Methyloceanibacter sp.]|jgi:outer membrane protein OmpA-like peptidoglycan-associated protein|nr:OmpA family protein [Methyloceanibacter sp.]